MTTALQDDAIIVNGHELRYWIDWIEADEYSLKIAGWALIVGIHSWQLNCKIDFIGASHSFSCKPQIIQRSDVTHSHTRKEENYDESGFLIEIPRQYVGQDCYNMYFTVRYKDSTEILLSYPFLATKIN